jgi:hypothetical protein
MDGKRLTCPNGLEETAVQGSPALGSLPPRLSWARSKPIGACSSSGVRQLCCTTSQCSAEFAACSREGARRCLPGERRLHLASLTTGRVMLGLTAECFRCLSSPRHPWGTDKFSYLMLCSSWLAWGRIILAIFGSFCGFSYHCWSRTSHSLSPTGT